MLPKVLTSSKKEVTLEDNVSNNKRHGHMENMSHDQIQCKKQKEKHKNYHVHKMLCVKCNFDDFYNSDIVSPDFKLYNSDIQFMYYNNAFFC